MQSHTEAGEDQAPAPDLRAAALHGVRWAAVARGIVEIALLGSMVVLARLIPPADFGRYAIALIAAELAVLFPSEAVGSALVQRKTVGREHLQAGFAVALLSGLAIGVLTLVAATVVVEPLFGARTAELVRLTAPLSLMTAASVVPMAILRRRLAFRRLSVLDITGSVVRAAACVVLALAGLNAEALVLGSLVATLVGTSLLWVSAPSPPPRLRRGPARDLLSYGLPASLASVSWVGFRNCDYAIIGARLGALQAGLYFRAYTLAVEYQKKVSLIMGQVGFPVLARSGSADEMVSLRGQMVRLLTILLFPLLALLAIVAPVLVPWLFGPAWKGAVVPTQILAVGGAATLVIDTVGVALMASGRPRALLGYGVAHFAAYAAAVFVVAPLGLAAVAVAAAVVHALFLYVAYALMLRDSPERPLPLLWNDVAPATVSCLGLIAVAAPAAVALAATPAPPVLQLAAVGLVGPVGYALSLRVCFPSAWHGLRSVVEHFLPDRPLRGWARRPGPAEARSAT